jgi:hypothetical protein
MDPYPTKCTSFSSKQVNTVSQLTFNLYSASIAADTWYLKSCTQMVKYYSFLIFLHIFLYSLKESRLEIQRVGRDWEAVTPV